MSFRSNTFWKVEFSKTPTALKGPDTQKTPISLNPTFQSILVNANASPSLLPSPLVEDSFRNVVNFGSVEVET